MSWSRRPAGAVSHGLLVSLLAAAIGVPAGWYAQQAIGDLITREVGTGPGLAIGPSSIQLAMIVGGALALVAIHRAGDTTVHATSAHRRPLNRSETE